jgi:hypothetical protein
MVISAGVLAAARLPEGWPPGMSRFDYLSGGPN